ncbi:MAG: BamA/TamA family outer membrane protein, partial [Bryobacteraceae bacterium]
VNATRLGLGEPHSDDKIGQAILGLRQVLESNGYYDTTITPEVEYEARRNQVKIDFLVETGKRARFQKAQVTGDPKLPVDDVAAATKWKNWLGWKPATQVGVQRGVERVRTKYQKQNRLKASITVAAVEHDSQSNGVRHTLDVQAGPTVEIRTVGAKVSRGKLRRYIPIYEERTVDRDLLIEGQRNLSDHFQSEGYFEAEVVFKDQRVMRDKAVIDYLVNLGKRHKLVHIEIEGNRYFDTPTIRERMYLLPASFQFRRGRFSEGFLRRDKEAIANLYRENGFRDVRVESYAIADWQAKVGDLAVFVRVEEGGQWFVNGLEVEGIEQLDRERILGILCSGEGQPFSEFAIAVDRDNILARYFSEGFSDATFEWSSKPSGKPNQVDLRFVIQEGKRRFVRQVLQSGLRTTQPDLVNRNLLIGVGDPLSQTRMGESQRQLYDLGIFARVNMAIQNPDGETQSKYVLYQMEEANRWSTATGFGAEIARIGGDRNSLADPGGAAGFSPRVSFDVSRINFRGLGHTVSVRTRLSSLQQRGLFNYTAPRLRNIPNLNLSFTALYDDSRDVRTFSAIRREGSVQLSQKLSKANTALYRFSYRRVTLGDLKISELLLNKLSQPVRVGMMSGTLIQDKRDDPVESRRGVYNTIDVGLASRAFGSEVDFLRVLGRNSTYHALGRNLVLARSLNLGWLNGFAAEQDIPLPERYFSGGSSSHRGFPDNQAGPRDELTGFPLGGRALLVNNVELRFPFLGDNIGGVVFHDAGNVYSRPGNFSIRIKQNGLTDFDYMVHAIGFGVRYRTPIGPVRLDLAYAINSPRFLGCTGTREDLLFRCGDPSVQRLSRFQFHFSIGQAF